MLEDIIHQRLCKDDKKFSDCDRFFFSIKKNLEYTLDGRQYEMDNMAIHIGTDHKISAFLFEAKLGNHSKSKAHKQLRRHYRYLLENSGVHKAYLFYAHGFNRRDNTYTIEWYRPYDNIKVPKIAELVIMNDTQCHQGYISQAENNKRKAMLYKSYDKRNHNYKKFGLEWQINKKINE